MRSRAGFTLIELMVAMALTLFVMVILSQAFVSSLDTFSGVKGIGDMQQNLRTAEVMLRSDLAQDHFEGKRRLSDIDANGQPLIVTQPPQAGFFVVRRSSPPVAAASATFATPYVFEGNDGFGVPSYRAVDQMLYMTVKRRGNRQEDFFNASLVGDPAVLTNFFSKATAYNVLPTPNAGSPNPDLPNSTLTWSYGGGPSGFYSSQWAEVIYYLVQTGSTEAPTDINNVTGTPVFSLYRAQFVMTPDGSKVSGQFANNLAFNGAPLPLSTFAGLSCNPGATTLTFNSPADAALGQRIIPDASAGSILTPRVAVSSTLVMPNVLSFHIQIMPVGQTQFIDVPPNTGASGAQPYGIYDTTRFNVAGFAGYPAGGIKGISVTLRVWDAKTRQTRQTTLIQDM